MLLQQHTHIRNGSFLSAMLRQLSHARSYHFVIAAWSAKEAESNSRVKTMITLPGRCWTIVGLLVALFSMPLVSALFTVLL